MNEPINYVSGYPSQIDELRPTGAPVKLLTNSTYGRVRTVPGWFMAVVTILLTICALASALFILVIIDVYFALAHLQAELSQLTAPFGN